MAQAKLTITVRMVWWWRPYVWLLVRIAVLAGCEQDWDKFGRMARRAMRVKVGC